MNHELYSIGAVIFGLSAIILSGVYSLVGRVGHYEIKRKAQLHQPGARVLYVLHQRGYEPLIGISLWQVLFTALFIVCLIEVLPMAISIIVATATLTIGGEIFASFFMQRIIRRRLDLLWPVLGKLLGAAKPLSSPVGRALQKRFGNEKPTIYSREHLLAILEAHGESGISEVDKKEISLIQSALEFQTKQVRRIMVHLEQFPKIFRDSSVGPVLLDELHAAGFAWYPVLESNQSHVVGVVSIHELSRMRSGGTVNAKLHEDMTYVHEEAPLVEVIQMYEATHETVFLVTNRFDDVVGLVTLEQILSQLFGEEVTAPAAEHTQQ